ncbi:hypothetical protein BCR39DRAFT_168420 [Naematelia encephala]|uniref:Chromo domain-containing protein n=1 Tax=Naematelia encephala TaxID=71784 RepID=A0A1Y2B4D1_9TREE|nr:hypothetical protein BCR39DRAFT_168420 [Naematelia encephala]
MLADCADLVSWRGYGPEHNTWEPQEHVEHAQDVVTAYWNTRPKTNSKQTAKRGRPSSTPQPSKSVKTAKTSNGGRRGRGSKSARQADDDEFDDDVPEFEATHVDSMDNYEDVRDWEELVKTVDTIEKTSDGLVVYMTIPFIICVYLVLLLCTCHRLGMIRIGGERVGQSTEVAYKRCPQKILKFYESHLKWKMATD